MQRTRQSPPALAEHADAAVRATGISDWEALAESHFECALTSGYHLLRSVLSPHCGRDCEAFVRLEVSAAYD
jgi:hypothetical protein